MRSTVRSNLKSTAIGAANESRREEGHALLLAIFALFLLGMSLSLTALNLQLGLGAQRRELGRVRVDLLVDAVVAETLGRLALDADFAGVQPTDLALGQVWSEVTTRGVEAVIEAGASLGQGGGRAVVRVRLGPGGPRIVSWRRGGVEAER